MPVMSYVPTTELTFGMSADKRKFAVIDEGGTARPIPTITKLTAAQFATYVGGEDTLIEVTDLPGRPQYRWDGVAFRAVSADVHPYYHFHGFAGEQILGDPKFYDRAASNHGVFGANLQNATAWANAGYVSTVDPVGGTTDSVIRIPSLNFDYAGGEKLILWWLGAATPEGADATLMGDAASSATPGVRVRMKTTGKFDGVLYGAGAVSRFGGASTGAVFDGALHSFALVFDGAAKKYGQWYDETYEAAFGASYSAFASGADADTRNAATWNIGSGSASPGGTEGAAVKTRAFHLVRLPASHAMPSVATLTELFKQLRASPGRSILAGAI